MYPLYFYLCLLFSVTSVLILILLAIFPIHLPIVVKTKQTQPIIHSRKARSPTSRNKVTNYWDPPWEDDDEDL